MIGFGTVVGSVAITFLVVVDAPAVAPVGIAPPSAPTHDTPHPGLERAHGDGVPFHAAPRPELLVTTWSPLGMRSPDWEHLRLTEAHRATPDDPRRRQTQGLGPGERQSRSARRQIAIPSLVATVARQVSVHPSLG
jgi:hypothetical protein